MAFEIVANNLERKSEIKSIKLQSEEYVVTIFYYGDYAKDMEAGKCSIDNLTVSCKPKGEDFPISFVSGAVVIAVPALPIVFVGEVDALKKNLDVAREAALELQKILEKYFRIVSV